MDPFDDPDFDDFDDWDNFDPYPDWKPYKIAPFIKTRKGIDKPRIKRWVRNTYTK